MSESGDYDPGPWQGYDFSSARATYDAHAGRSYDNAVKSNVSAKDIVPNKIKTKSKAPVVVVSDVTGSMGEWPVTIFSKLPYLDLEGKEYLGNDMELCFAAVGDAAGDDYPLQVQKFSSGKKMEKSLEALIHEKGGGGNVQESYELAALYFANNCEMPNAVNPIIIFIADEEPYDYLAEEYAKTWAKCKIKSGTSVADAFNQLKQKFSVYAVVKPYYNENGNATNKKLYDRWVNLLGADHVCSLSEAGRIVDVIFGIFAQETSRIDYFEDELKGRQTKDQVNVVLKSLHTIHDANVVRKTIHKHGQSMTHRKNKPIATSKGLLD